MFSVLRLSALVFVTAALATSLCPAQSPTQRATRAKVRRAVTDYYISPRGKDSADGSAAHPWATLTRAANVLQPGAIFHVAPGLYQAPVITSVSGTPGARVRYVSDVKWGARIATTGAGVSWYNYGDYVDIVNFDVTGDSNIGIASEGMSVQIIGNHVHDLTVPNIGCSQGGAGISHAGYNTSGNVTIDNVVDHIGVNNPQSCAHGVYDSTAGGVVQNNIINNFHGCGVSTWHAATHMVVSNNLIFNGQGPQSCGILIGAGDAPGGVTNDYSIVTNNIVIYNSDQNGGGYGIEEFGQTGVHNLYANNLLYGNTVPISLQNGLSASATIAADPKLVNYQSDGSGDYHLQPGSPAIGAGTFLGAPGQDIDGVPRPPGHIDLGPYQSGGQAVAGGPGANKAQLGVSNQQK
jgi:hypothetical protein